MLCLRSCRKLYFIILSHLSISVNTRRLLLGTTRKKQVIIEIMAIPDLFLFSPQIQSDQFKAPLRKLKGHLKLCLTVLNSVFI